MLVIEELTLSEAPRWSRMDWSPAILVLKYCVEKAGHVPRKGSVMAVPLLMLCPIFSMLVMPVLRIQKHMAEGKLVSLTIGMEHTVRQYKEGENKRQSLQQTVRWHHWTCLLASATHYAYLPQALICKAPSKLCSRACGTELVRQSQCVSQYQRCFWPLVL